MKRFLSGICVVLIFTLSAAGSFLRLFQLLRYTDKDTGLVSSNYSFSYAIYAIFAVCLCICAVYAFSFKERKSLTALSSNKFLRIVCEICVVTYFSDFVYRGVKLYGYLSDTEYIEYNYAAFYALSCLFALLSSAYFMMCSRYLKGYRFRFKYLGALHFAVPLWAFSRIAVIMIKIVDFDEGTESICEFMFLVSFICFSFSFIYAVDREDGTGSAFLAASAMMTFFSSFALAAPRLLAVLFGKAFLLYDTSFLSTTDFMCAILSVSVVLPLCFNPRRDGIQKVNTTS